MDLPTPAFSLYKILTLLFISCGESSISQMGASTPKERVPTYELASFSKTMWAWKKLDKEGVSP